MSDAVETEITEAEQTPRKEKTVSKRGRRLLLAIIIVLLLALTGISALLVSFIVPKGRVASGSEAGEVTWVRSIYGWGTTPDKQFSSPRKVFVEPNGTIWVTDTHYQTAMAFNPEGKLVKTAAKKPKQRVVGFGPIAVGPENAVFIGEPSMDRIRVFSSSDQDLGFVPFPNPIEFDFKNGTLVAGSKAGFAFLDPNTGQPKKTIGSAGYDVGMFDNANGLSIGKNGNVYVTDMYNNRLSAYKSDGTRLWTVVTGAAGNKVDVSGAGAEARSQVSSAPAQLSLPADVTVDGNGHLVVVDAFDFSIAVFDAKDGKFLKKYGQYGSDDGQLMYPSSIAYDPQRDWFVVADTGNARVQIIRLPNSGGAFDVASTVRRSITGPLRACIPPLALLIIVAVLFVVSRARRKKAEKAAA